MRGTAAGCCLTQEADDELGSSLRLGRFVDHALDGRETQPSTQKCDIAVALGKVYKFFFKFVEAYFFEVIVTHVQVKEIAKEAARIYPNVRMLLRHLVVVRHKRVTQQHE